MEDVDRVQPVAVDRGELGAVLAIFAEARDRYDDGAGGVHRTADKVKVPHDQEGVVVTGCASQRHADAEEGNAEARQGHAARGVPGGSRARGWGRVAW